MAVTCKKCSKTISRYDDSIPCSKDSSHLFHIQCVNLTVENFETMKKSGTSKSWLCEDCSFVDITSKIDNSENIPTITQIPSESLLKSIEIVIAQSFRSLFLPVVEGLKLEIANLQDQVSNLRAENSKLLRSINHPDQKQSKVRTFNEVIKPSIDQNRRGKKLSASSSEVEEVEKPQQVRTSPSSKALETTTISCPSKSESQINKEDEFIAVKNRRAKRNNKSIVGSGKPDGMSIKGAIRYGYLHVCKLDPSLKPEALVGHLNTNGFNDIICEKLESKRPEEYSSFKLTVPAQNFEEIKNPALWPEVDVEHHRNVKPADVKRFIENQKVYSFLVSSKTGEGVNCCFLELVASHLGVPLTNQDKEQQHSIVKAEIMPPSARVPTYQPAPSSVCTIQ